MIVTQYQLSHTYTPKTLLTMRTYLSLCAKLNLNLQRKTAILNEWGQNRRLSEMTFLGQPDLIQPSRWRRLSYAHGAIFDVCAAGAAAPSLRFPANQACDHPRLSITWRMAVLQPPSYNGPSHGQTDGDVADGPWRAVSLLTAPTGGPGVGKNWEWLRGFRVGRLSDWWNLNAK